MTGDQAMSDFSPVILFAIIREMLGPMFWPAAVVAVTLAAAVVLAVIRAYRRGRGLCAAFVVAVAAGLVVTALAALLAPSWTHAQLSDLQAPVDVIAAIALGLTAGALAAGLAFIVTTFVATLTRTSDQGKGAKIEMVKP